MVPFVLAAAANFAFRAAPYVLPAIFRATASPVAQRGVNLVAGNVSTVGSTTATVAGGVVAALDADAAPAEDRPASSAPFCPAPGR